MMMFGIMGPMMMGLGALMMGMFSGFFDIFFMPMWTMMAGWFGLLS